MLRESIGLFVLRRNEEARTKNDHDGHIYLL